MKPKTPKTPGPVAVNTAAAGATDGDVTPKGKANARAKAAPARGPQGGAMPKPAAPKPAQRAGDRAAATPAAKPPLATVPDATDTPDTSAEAVAAGKTGMAGALKMKDLIDKVAQATGGKKAAVRDVVEATLRILGDALSQGVMVNLPPFGKAKVSRMAEPGSGKPMIIKLRRLPATQGTGGGNPMQTLADPDD